MADSESAALVARLAERLRQRGWRIATAESCTGGLVAACCTELAGSSDWFERGVVCYSNASKTELLGVDAALIEHEGAVSEAVVHAMAAGALERSAADLVVAITGIAGPAGGSAAKPVGTVWLAWAHRDGPRVVVDARCEWFAGDRATVRQATARCALRGLIERVP